MTKLNLKPINADAPVSIIIKEFSEKKIPNPFRILDMGCGGGSLMAHLHTSLKKIYPETSIEIFGYEIIEHSGSYNGYLNTVISNLESIDKNTDWWKRIFVISNKDKLPFDDDFFDCVVSTQVIEHVKNHDLFLSENQRILKEGGVGIHSYSSREKIIDEHLGLFFIHKMIDSDIIKAYIILACKLKMGKFNKDSMSIDQYVEQKIEYITKRLNHISIKEVLKLCKKNNLQGTLTRYIFSRCINNIRKRHLGGLIFRIFKIENKPIYFKTKNLFLNIIEKIILLFSSRFKNVTLIIKK